MLLTARLSALSPALARGRAAALFSCPSCRSCGRAEADAPLSAETGTRL